MTLLAVSFVTYKRRRSDVLMTRLVYISLRRFGDVPLRRCCMFHLRIVWDVAETY